jgi:predicted enzyme related to lactoylglutathione lyase
MFDDSRAFTSFAAPDIAAARQFYEGALGLRVTEEAEPNLLTLHLGDRQVMVYPKDDHQPANFTILNFPVDDVEAAVDRLTEQGVSIERYEGFPHDERGIVREGGGPPIAWFTDPAGNILAVMQLG